MNNGERRLVRYPPDSMPPFQPATAAEQAAHISCTNQRRSYNGRALFVKEIVRLTTIGGAADTSRKARPNSLSAMWRTTDLSTPLSPRAPEPCLAQQMSHLGVQQHHAINCSTQSQPPAPIGSNPRRAGNIQPKTGPFQPVLASPAKSFPPATVAAAVRQKSPLYGRPTKAFVQPPRANSL